MSKTSELTHLFRELEAPAAARALPKLADRARAEEWSSESLPKPCSRPKTHLAIALGIRACLAGQRAIFKTATEWVALLAEQQRQGRLDEELKRLERYPLLICDEQQAVRRLGRDLRR
jgi:hypothetical protein